MMYSNADFSRLVSSKRYILVPDDAPLAKSSNNSNKTKQSDPSQVNTDDAKKAEKKRKRAERKKKYFERRKAAKEKERAEKEEEEFNRRLKEKLSKV